jgi:NAD(P)-dependent dehydrogenase (short-subunit alcohol dehydrogenase family)
MWPGIGRLTAVALAGAGWNVTLTGRRRDALAETVKLCSSNSERCLIVAGNITNEQFVEQLFEDTVGHFGTSIYYSAYICYLRNPT